MDLKVFTRLREKVVRLKAESLRLEGARNQVLDELKTEYGLEVDEAKKLLQVQREGLEQLERDLEQDRQEFDALVEKCRALAKPD